MYQKVCRCRPECALFLLVLILPVWAGCLLLPSSTPPSPGRAVLWVDHPGLYEVRGSDLLTLGWPSSALHPARLRLTHRGTPVAVQVSGQGQDLRLRFYGWPRESLYGGARAFLLTSGSPSPSIPIRESQSVGGRADVLTRQRVEKDRFYNASLPADTDHWLWLRATAQAPVSVSFVLTDVVPAPSTLTLTLVGISATPHRVHPTLNDHPLPSITWEGSVPFTVTLPLPTDVLRAGPNTLTLYTPATEDTLPDVWGLDALTVTYRRLARGTRTPWLFQGSGLVQIDWQGGRYVLWEVTDPQSPIIWKPASKGAPVDTGPPGRTFLLADQSRPLQPRITPAPPPWTPPQGGADYLVVVPEPFLPALAPLLEWHRSQGLRPAVITVQQLYDRYTHSMPDPMAPRALLQEAATWSQPPRFLLLAGDASYDPRDLVQGPEKNWVPTPLVATRMLGETASDDVVADLDGDGFADLAVGRFPAQDREQLAVMVSKTLRAGQGISRRVLFVADPSSPQFKQVNTALATALPSAMQPTHVLLSEAGPRSVPALLRETWGLVVYSGHGSITLWGKGGEVNAQTMAALTGPPFLLTTLNCLNGYFLHPRQVSLAEAALRARGGAFAVLASTGATYVPPQQRLAEALLRALQEQPTLGEAVLQAKRALRMTDPPDRDVVQTFHLLGDPAFPTGPLLAAVELRD